MYPDSYPVSLRRHRYRGISLMRNRPTPWGFHRALDVVLLWGPRMALNLMGEVPLY